MVETVSQQSEFWTALAQMARETEPPEPAALTAPALVTSEDRQRVELQHQLAQQTGKTLQQQYWQHKELCLETRRLLFARWLYLRGKLTDFPAPEWLGTEADPATWETAA